MGPRLVYQFHPPGSERHAAQYVPHHFYIPHGEYTGAVVAKLFNLVDQWCDEEFGEPSMSTWWRAGMSFCITDDALAFQMKMRWC